MMLNEKSGACPAVIARGPDDEAEQLVNANFECTG